jgi:hypothetical protein
VNIQKRELCVKGVLAQDLVFICGLFAKDWRILGVDMERGAFQLLGEARRVYFRLIRAHWFLPPPIPHPFSTHEVNIPGVVGVTIKVIVINGGLKIMLNKDLTDLYDVYHP